MPVLPSDFATKQVFSSSKFPLGFFAPARVRLQAAAGKGKTPGFTMVPKL
jgi:hypothetical protein